MSEAFEECLDEMGLNARHEEKRRVMREGSPRPTKTELTDRTYCGYPRQNTYVNTKRDKFTRTIT